MILSLQTNTFGSFGGIPTYNRLVCRVLEQSEHPEGSIVLIAMDQPEDVERQAAAYTNLSMAGFGGDRFKFVKAAMRAVLKNDIKLILAGHVNYAPLCLLLRILRPQLKFGIFIYGWDIWFKVPVVRAFALRRANFLISISDYTKSEAVQINRLNASRIWVLPNAIDAAPEILPTGPIELPRGTKILSVGRLESSEQQKGFDTIIRALPAIIASVADVQYIIVGSGTDLERHKQLARDVGVTDRVHLLGNVGEKTLGYCYQCADVFAMPSAQEGFGFVYLEAMRYAKAVVAARSGGAPEVVEDQVTGTLVEYGNQEEISRALIDLCLNPDKRQAFGASGYERLQDRFSFNRFKSKLNAILLQELTNEGIVRPESEAGQSASVQ